MSVKGFFAGLLLGIIIGITIVVIKLRVHVSGLGTVLFFSFLWVPIVLFYVLKRLGIKRETALGIAVGSLIGDLGATIAIILIIISAVLEPGL